MNMLELNREILLNPKSAAANELLALLELESPGLEFLCPMARAIYWIETKRTHLIDIREAIGDLWLVDEREARGTEEYGDNAYVEEIVRHSLVTTLEDTQITLGFESCTEMQYCDEFWSDYLRYSNGLAWDFDMSKERVNLFETWFRALDTEAQEIRRTPEGYPSDDGDFLGVSTYTLNTINGLSVVGPTFTDNNLEQEWENLSEEYSQRWDDEAEEKESAFCWLHYLSREQAEQLGIAAQADQALGPDLGYPEWTPKDLQGKSDAFWIHSDEIQDSYAKGTVIVVPSESAFIAVGCGADWEPNDIENHIDLEDEPNWEEFPETAGPVLKLEISRNSEQLPPEVATLLPYWRQLRNLQGTKSD